MLDFSPPVIGDEEVTGYHRWFPRAPGTMTGEWTPDYLTFPWVPPLLQRAAPDARLVIGVDHCLALLAVCLLAHDGFSSSAGGLPPSTVTV